MDSAWPLLMFLAGLMGSGLLILICGVREREQERAENPGLEMPPRPSFFATLSAAFEVTPEVDDELVRGFEEQLRQKTAAAERFVDEPSVVTFHGLSEEELLSREQSLFQRIQSFLEQERAWVNEFLVDPSLHRLHGQLEPVAL